MKNWVVIPAVIMLFLLASSPACARGGGGCIIKGTPVLTPSGIIAIEKLHPGDPVLSISGGKLQNGMVKARTEVQPDDYVEITAGEHKLLVTPEHPVMVAPGEYRIARLIRAGDNVYEIRNRKIQTASVSLVRRIELNQPAYNLLVMPGGTFIPAGIVVHNKGCFLPDSEILKSDGTKKFISSIRRGDELLAYSPEGKIVHTKVKEIIRHKVDEYFLLKTDHTTLRVTAEHPFYTGNGTFKTLEVLKVGDAIFAWDGQTLSQQRIVSLEKIHERVQVFNLQTDHPNTFFAAGLAVHNKGGGGGCFPAGTMIRTPSGQIPIENLSGNDIVQAVDREGQIINTRVEEIFASRSHILSVGYVHLLSVRRGFRRQGLANRLYAHFEQYARSRGCTRLKAITSPVNTLSIDFHRSIGMLPSGEPDSQGLPVVKDYSGPGRDRVVFLKDIVWA